MQPCLLRLFLGDRLGLLARLRCDGLLRRALHERQAGGLLLCLSPRLRRLCLLGHRLSGGRFCSLPLHLQCCRLLLYRRLLPPQRLLLLLHLLALSLQCLSRLVRCSRGHHQRCTLRASACAAAAGAVRQSALEPLSLRLFHPALRQQLLQILLLGVREIFHILVALAVKHVYEGGQPHRGQHRLHRAGGTVQVRSGGGGGSRR